MITDCELFIVGVWRLAFESKFLLKVSV